MSDGLRQRKLLNLRGCVLRHRDKDVLRSHALTARRHLIADLLKQLLAQQIDAAGIKATILLFKVSPGDLVDGLVAQIFDAGIGRQHAFVGHGHLVFAGQVNPGHRFFCQHVYRFWVGMQ